VSSLRAAALTAAAASGLDTKAYDQGTRREPSDRKEVSPMPTYRVTMSFLMDADSKEKINARVNAALGERLEFLSVMEHPQPPADRKPKPEAGWLEILVKQLTGK
jgi:hypothetical protein